MTPARYLSEVCFDRSENILSDIVIEMVTVESSFEEYWERLSQTVSSAVNSGRIGVPKALRVVVHLQSRSHGLEDAIQEQAAVAVRRSATDWFNEEVDRESVVGEPGSPTGLLVRWSGGQSALLLISAGISRIAGSLVLMGSHGTIYHRIESNPIRSTERGD